MRFRLNQILITRTDLTNDRNNFFDSLNVRNNAREKMRKVTVKDCEIVDEK